MSRDPVDRSLLRLEARRFATKCEAQVALINRADSLREVVRLANIAVPYALIDDYTTREAQRQVQLAAEDRARDLISDQVQNWLRAEPIAQDKFKRAMTESWVNLTGPLGHLRTWAIAKQAAAEQSRPVDVPRPQVPGRT